MGFTKIHQIYQLSPEFQSSTNIMKICQIQFNESTPCTEDFSRQQFFLPHSNPRQDEMLYKLVDEEKAFLQEYEDYIGDDTQFTERIQDAWTHADRFNYWTGWV